MPTSASLKFDILDDGFSCSFSNSAEGPVKVSRTSSSFRPEADRPGRERPLEGSLGRLLPLSRDVSEALLVGKLVRLPPQLDTGELWDEPAGSASSRRCRGSRKE